MGSGLMVPTVAVVERIRELTDDTLLFDVVPRNGTGPVFDHLPGQFAELSIFGAGECPISITSTPTRGGAMEFAIRDAGRVTHAFHDLDPGARIGIRGPLGRPFPVDEMRGHDVYFIAGGIGLAPLRGLINYVLDRRDSYGAVDIVYGARSPDLLCFRDEFETWATAPNTRLHVTVDHESPGWDGLVGFVPAIVSDLSLPPDDRIAVACGPPIMIKYTLADLAQAGYRSEQVITTLELKMQCGVGKCGRCNIGPKYVCVDGPVFRLDELEQLPEEY